MKAVLFDLFGTLVDNFTNESVAQLHHDIAAVLEVDSEEFRRGWKATFHDRQIGKYKSVGELIAGAASHCSAAYNREGLDRAVQIRYEFSRRWLAPRPDAISTLSELKLRGFTTGLLSNCSEEIPEMWPATSFNAVIDVPLFSCREGFRKPMPEFFQRALNKFGVKAAECLYVADGDNGELAAATALAMSAIMIRTGDDEFRNEEEEWDGVRISSLSELLSFTTLAASS